MSSPETFEDEEGNQQRLEQLNALLASQFAFQSPSPSPPPATLPSQPSDDPEGPANKRKKTQHSPQPETVQSGAVADEKDEGEQTVAFRLFSTQKAPQTVVLREAKAPELVVLDRRIRAVEDEPAEVVAARTAAIESLVVEGSSLLSTSSLPTRPLGPTRHARLPPQLCRSHTLPHLAFLSARLPPALSSFSPGVVPDEVNAPKEPNEGLLNNGPYKHLRVPFEQEAEKRIEKTSKKDTRPRQAKRSKVEEWELQEGVRLQLKVVPVLAVEKAGGKGVMRAEGAKVQSGKGKRLSKARRERVKKRVGAKVAVIPVAAVVATAA